MMATAVKPCEIGPMGQSVLLLPDSLFRNLLLRSPLHAGCKVPVQLRGSYPYALFFHKLVNHLVDSFFPDRLRAHCLCLPAAVDFHTFFIIVPPSCAKIVPEISKPANVINFCFILFFVRVLFLFSGVAKVGGSIGVEDNDITRIVCNYSDCRVFLLFHERIVTQVKQYPQKGLLFQLILIDLLFTQ